MCPLLWWRAFMPVSGALNASTKVAAVLLLTTATCLCSVVTTKRRSLRTVLLNTVERQDDSGLRHQLSIPLPHSVVFRSASCQTTSDVVKRMLATGRFSIEELRSAVMR